MDSDEAQKLIFKLFSLEGVLPEVAQVASEACFVDPSKRTPEQQQAYQQVTQKVAENDQKLNLNQTEDCSVEKALDLVQEWINENSNYDQDNYPDIQSK
jgi:hypothetical protein